ncbi:MAG: methyltransferase domain-containing protein [Pseudomonadota bacterium]
MTERGMHVDEYDDAMVALLELVWGKGFMAPGGPQNVRKLVSGLDVRDKTILDIGCGLGGGDLLLAGELGARVIGIDLEAPLIARARAYAEEAGLSDRIEYHQVDPGPLGFEDGTLDVVYSSGAFTQTADKAGIFADALQVLKPGGSIMAYEWMGNGEPFSEDMLHWFELEGLTYALQSLPAHKSLLEDAGFYEVAVTDDGGWCTQEARVEYDLRNGEMKETAMTMLGTEQYAHFLEDWAALITVLSSGELVPGFLRGKKPG